MTKHDTLNLSAWQRQAIADMGIRAWYLTPLHRTETADDREHTVLIDTLVDSLADTSVLPTSQVSPQQISPQQEPPSAMTEASPEVSSANDVVTVTPSVGDIIQSATTATPIPMPSKTQPAGEGQSVGTAGKPARRVIQPPPPIKLPQQQNGSTQSLNTVNGDGLGIDNFIFPEQPQGLSWDTLQAAAVALAQTAQQPCFWGQQNNLDADELFVFPPPDRLREQHHPDNNHHHYTDDAEDANTQPQTVNEPAIHEPISHAKEQQLLGEMLASIGVDWQAGYSTRLLKHTTRYGQDPDATELSAHLSLLASELALTQPRRIWLFGTLACRSVTRSSAPLSALMGGHYSLRYTGRDGATMTAQLLCLPSVDYLLALPSEKGKVWNILKNLK